MILPFDIYAMVNPKTPEDYVLLLDEALAQAEYIGELLDANFKELEDKFGVSDGNA